MISAKRAAWYAATDGHRLRRARQSDWPGLAPTTVHVLIPTYNRSAMLAMRALPSVMAQSYEHLRIIVLDHGSTDLTCQVVKDFQLRDPRILYVRVPRRHRYPDTPENRWYAGPVEPLNVGLSLCPDTGFIARIDDDDTWSPHHIFHSLIWLKHGDLEFVSAAHETHQGPVSPYVMGVGTQRETMIGGCQTWVYRAYLRCFRYNPDCWRKSWNRVNDTDLQYRMWKSGVRMGYRADVTAAVLPRPGESDVGLAAYTSRNSNQQ